MDLVIPRSEPAIKIELVGKRLLTHGNLLFHGELYSLFGLFSLNSLPFSLLFKLFPHRSSVQYELVDNSYER